MDDPGLVFAETGVCADIPSLLATDAGADTRWSGPVNVPWRARFTAAEPDAVLLGAGWDDTGVCCCCVCASSSVWSCSSLRDSPDGGPPSEDWPSAAMGRLRTRMSLRIRILMPWSAREQERGVDSVFKVHSLKKRGRSCGEKVHVRRRNRVMIRKPTNEWTTRTKAGEVR